MRLRGVVHSHAVGLGLRRRTVLQQVDLEVPAGAGVGLVGPNGSGKSSLLRVLAGVDDARAGEVRVLGGSPRDVGVHARVGWMPEESPFPPELRPLAALELIGTLNGLRRREARARGRELLARVGLGGETRTTLGRFSRGMLRRFGLAQALLHEPELLLLDEPTAGLDAPGYEVLDELLGDARARGATLVISSHLVADVHRHCDRLVVLVEGRVAAQGTSAEVLALAGDGRAGAELEVAGLDAAGLDALEREIGARGGRLLATRPSQASLLALYRRKGEPR